MSMSTKKEIGGHYSLVSRQDKQIFLQNRKWQTQEHKIISLIIRMHIAYEKNAEQA